MSKPPPAHCPARHRPRVPPMHYGDKPNPVTPEESRLGSGSFLVKRTYAAHRWSNDCALLRSHGMRVLEEEAEHLPRGVGSSRIGVGAGGAAARPGMTSSVDDPLLEDRFPARGGKGGAAVGMAAGYSTLL